MAGVQPGEAINQHPLRLNLQVEFTPYFLIPVGGVYRTFMSVSRMVEPAPAAYKYPGYPVSKTVVTLDKASGIQAARPCLHSEMRNAD